MRIDLTITDPKTNRAASITQPRADAPISVAFGWIEKVRTDSVTLANNPKAPATRTEFRCAPGTPSRTYKTEFTARKAAQRWIDRV